MKETTTPEKTFRAGLISVAIWKNKTTPKEGEEARAFYSVKLDRRYQDAGTEEWKSTAQLSINDIPRAIVLLGKAFAFLISPPRTKDDDPSDSVELVE